MKNSHKAAAAAVAVFAMVGGSWVALHSPSSKCDESLWNHVYASPGHPNRLSDPDPKVHHRCVQATGTIREVKREADGDIHIQLDLDVGQETLLAQGNRDRQHGYLVLEIICAAPVQQRDTLEQHSCDGYTNKVLIPKVGQHVKVTGTFVYDQENSQHDWNELHPVSSVVIQ